MELRNKSGKFDMFFWLKTRKQSTAVPQQQNKLAPVRGETTVPRHHNEPLVTSHKNRDSENRRSEFLFKVRKMAKNEIIFIQSEIFFK